MQCFRELLKPPAHSADPPFSGVFSNQVRDLCCMEGTSLQHCQEAEYLQCEGGCEQWLPLISFAESEARRDNGRRQCRTCKPRSARAPKGFWTCAEPGCGKLKLKDEFSSNTKKHICSECMRVKKDKHLATTRVDVQHVQIRR